MRICEVFDKSVLFMEAMEMSCSLSSCTSSCLFPRIPLMLMWRNVVRAIMSISKGKTGVFLLSE